MPKSISRIAKASAKKNGLGNGPAHCFPRADAPLGASETSLPQGSSLPQECPKRGLILFHVLVLVLVVLVLVVLVLVLVVLVVLVVVVVVVVVLLLLLLLLLLLCGRREEREGWEMVERDGAARLPRSPNFAHRAPRCAAPGCRRTIAKPRWRRAALQPGPRRARRDSLRTPGGDLGRVRASPSPSPGSRGDDDGDGP